MIISKFTDKGGGRVKVELVKPLLKKSENVSTNSLCSKQKTFEEPDNYETEDSSSYCGSDPDSDDSSSSVSEKKNSNI